MNHDYRRQKWTPVTVDPKGAGHTYRLAVPGGWLYRTITYRYPELHELLERWDSTQFATLTRGERTKAMEIATQTTAFVPNPWPAKVFEMAPLEWWAK